MKTDCVAIRGYFQGWERVPRCDCWSLLTFATLHFGLVLLCISGQFGTASTFGGRWRVRPVVWHVRVLPPCLGEWKDFSNFICKLLTHRLCFCRPPHFSCIHSSSSQDPFPLLIRLGFLVYFSGPVPCKSWLNIHKAKGVQYISNTEAYVANGLCNFPCLSCLNLTRTKHSSNFFGIKPCDWERAQQAVCARSPHVISKLVILLEYGWTEPSRTNVSLEAHMPPLHAA